MRECTNRHYTPIEIAGALSRHAPKKITALLDPSVGKGVLLSPLIKTLARSASEVVCIDRDNMALAYVRRNIQPFLDKRITLVNQDFLSWKSGNETNGMFDCVVMNPPFMGKKRELVAVNIEDSETENKKIAYLPTEVAFLLKAIRLLKDKGTLLAVVPGSIVAASSSSTVRKMILSKGWVKYVHELPRYSFKDVEARFYLFVFIKGVSQKHLTLCNHDLFVPEKIIVKSNELHKQLNQETRFDFSHNQAMLWLGKVKRRNKKLKWKRVSDCSRVIRGSLESPKGASVGIHTCDYHSGFWNPAGRLSSNAQIHEPQNRNIRKGDLLIKRVARGAAKSLGPVIGFLSRPCSDCLFIIRPTKICSSRLLFAMRTILAWDQGARLIERGTGSTYVTENSLLELVIPTDLHVSFKDKFTRYQVALKSSDGATMVGIEDEVRALLGPR